MKNFLISDFGLVEAPDVSIIKDWLSGIYPELDFPQPDFWKPKFSDLNHGAHAAVFFNTTAFDMGVMSMRLVGFEIRDTITWHHGHGTELIVLARKPLEKGLSIAENVLKYGTGGINVDGCRVGLSFMDAKDNGRIINRNIREGDDGWGMQDKNAEKVEVLSSQGRFPANLVMSHHPECTLNGLKKVKSDAHHTTKYNGNKTLYKGGWKDGKDFGNKLADENGRETVEDWTCHENCPIQIMDQQSGVKTSGKVKFDKESYLGHSNTKFIRGYTNAQNQHGDSGGASRFFPHLNYTNADSRIPQTLLNWLEQLINPTKSLSLKPLS